MVRKVTRNQRRGRVEFSDLWVGSSSPFSVHQSIPKPAIFHNTSSFVRREKERKEKGERLITDGRRAWPGVNQVRCAKRVWGGEFCSPHFRISSNCESDRVTEIWIFFYQERLLSFAESVTREIRFGALYATRGN